MDSSDRSSKSVTSPTADEIPKDIAAEFQRMSDDADALLQSIRNDEVKAATPRRERSGGGAAANPGDSSANREAAGRAGSFDEDDDMTDELHHLETVPDELQRLQRELDEVDQDKLTELIHGKEEEETFDQNQLRTTPLLSSSASSKQREDVGASCSAAAAPHFAVGNVKSNASPAMYCQEVAGTTGSGSGIPRQRKGAKSSSKGKSPVNDATTTLAVPHPSSPAADPSSSPSGVIYPYDPAVAELRELMKGAIDDDDDGDGNDDENNNNSSLVLHRGTGTGKHPALYVPSHGRVLKPAPKSTLESINWVLVAAFVVVWATVVVLMGRAHTDLLDEEGEVVHLPSILR